MEQAQTVEFKRMIPSGGINPNTNLSYLNMEGALCNYFNSHNNRVPITFRMTTHDTAYDPTIRLDDVVGYATSFTDDAVTVEMNGKSDLGKYLDEYFIEIVSTVDKDKQTILNITKLVISKRCNHV